MAYSLSNICTKNCWNRTTVVKIIVGGWVVSVFETVYIGYRASLSSRGKTRAIATYSTAHVRLGTSATARYS